MDKDEEKRERLIEMIAEEISIGIDYGRDYQFIAANIVALMENENKKRG